MLKFRSKRAERSSSRVQQAVAGQNGIGIGEPRLKNSKHREAGSHLGQYLKERDRKEERGKLSVESSDSTNKEAKQAGPTSSSKCPNLHRGVGVGCFWKGKSIISLIK